MGIFFIVVVCGGGFLVLVFCVFVLLSYVSLCVCCWFVGGWCLRFLFDIPIVLDAGMVLDELRMFRSRDKLLVRVQGVLDGVLPVVRPRAVFDVCFVEGVLGDTLTINGVDFTSRVLRVNLEKSPRVFPFIVTVGDELDGVVLPGSEMFLDLILNVVLFKAYDYLRDHIVDTFRLGRVTNMAPGELEDWPITQQRGLFALFEEQLPTLGVRLTESLMMIPLKSLSGIIFPTETSFESCQLCTQSRCMGRKAPYDPSLKELYGIQ